MPFPPCWAGVRQLRSKNGRNGNQSSNTAFSLKFARRAQMKSLIIPTLAGVSFSTFLVCGIVAASSFSPSYAPHKFENLQAGIGTSGVVRIDQSEQTFERVAAIAPPRASNQVFTVRDPINDHSVEATGGSAMQTASASTPDSYELCKQRYKSYRADDNSYQPLNGGPRRQCEVGSTARPSQPSNTVADNAIQGHEAWCQSRYSSYNPDDGSYQPLSGGKRRICASPVAYKTSG
jgi:hypothetical protein